jgi:hypothetical protein
MTFDELLVEVKKVKCEERRAAEVDYCEVVVTKSGLRNMSDVLEACFGLPLKPEGVAPSKEASLYAQPFGGIRGTQTMYFRTGDKGPELALLWPWGSGDLVTVKIIRTGVQS